MPPSRLKVILSRATTPTSAARSQPTARRIAYISLCPTSPAPRPASPLTDRSYIRTWCPSDLSNAAAKSPPRDPPTIPIRKMPLFCLNLLRALKRQFNLTYVFISHDLNVVQYVSDRVLVMYLGRVVEIGPIDAIFERPLHPYTSALLASRPSMDPARRIEEPPIAGDPPNPIDPPSGCRFHTRCPFAEPVCESMDPTLGALEGPRAHVTACHMRDPLSGHRRYRAA